MRTIVVKEKFGGAWRDSANCIYMNAQTSKVELLDYWRTALALYVTKKRMQAGKAQKEVGASRKTVSSLENFSGNPTLEIILAVMASIGGDISEAFRSHVPKALHGEQQVLHEMLQRILETGKTQAVDAMSSTIKAAFEVYVVQDRT